MQLEYPWVLGPPDGRYVLRGHAGVPAHVLVLATLGSVERRGLLGRGGGRARRVAPEPEPTPVVTARATLVAAEPSPPEEAARWLAAADLRAEAAAAVRTLNEVLHAQRTAAADPAVRDVGLAAALAVRVGIGEGEQVAHGRWREAKELPAAARRGAMRSAAVLRPQERLAAILAGRDVALACEELTLRARADCDAGRSREAALQLRVALECAVAELTPWADREQVAARLGGLQAERTTASAAANLALGGGLDTETIAEVERVLGLLEAALRARTAVGLE